MHFVRISIIVLLCLAVTLSTGNETPNCDQSDGSFIYLDVATEMITKAKSHYLASIRNQITRPIDCTDIFHNGHNRSGVYTIWPKNRLTDETPLDVFCDMDTDGGGWTVLQRRGNFNRPNDYFYKDWASYKSGFGNNEKDFWIGNDNMFALTNQRLYSIRFDLTDVNGNKRYAIYDTFWIDDEYNKYRLHIKDYSGDAGDSMTERHDNMAFTTKDQHNDPSKENCADQYKGGWWYKDCHYANLNGLFLKEKHKVHGIGVHWHSWEVTNESLEAAEMKIRPKHFKKIVS